MLIGAHNDGFKHSFTRKATSPSPNRSPIPAEIARLAIAEYLNHREKERFMTELANEMRNGYAKPEIRRAALAMAEELTDDGLNAIIADERVAGLEPREKWWR